MDDDVPDSCLQGDRHRGQEQEAHNSGQQLYPNAKGATDLLRTALLRTLEEREEADKSVQPRLVCEDDVLDFFVAERFAKWFTKRLAYRDVPSPDLKEKE